jgi:hypothetical protein
MRTKVFASTCFIPFFMNNDKEKQRYQKRAAVASIHELPRRGIFSETVLPV